MRLSLIVVVVMAVPSLAQVEPAAVEELNHVFDRPAGTVIQQPQKEKLLAWLKAHEGKDLGAYGYAKALPLYFERDLSGAVAVLERFVAEGHRIANEEHRSMAGRVFLNALATEARAETFDEAKLARYGEATARLYRDTAMLTRLAKPVLSRAKDPAALRVALTKGVVASDLSAAAKDAFVRDLYDASAPAGATPAGEGGGGSRVVPGTPIRPLPASAAPDAATGLAPGAAVEPFAFERVVNGPSGFTYESCKGKVLVLDFFASWCGPCREALPSMVALQKSLSDEVQVLGVTRYYGRGMDFSGEGATAPHGGASRSELDHEQEAALYGALVKLFGVNYPIVFPVDQTLGSTRFGVRGIPTMAVIGKDGKLVGTVVGGGEKNHHRLLELVDQARKS